LLLTNQTKKLIIWISTTNIETFVRVTQKSSHFFLNYRNEKCTNQVIGKGTIGSWPSKIAEYLKLKNPAGYTGNSFRRSALLANKIEDPGLKRHGGCKSSITAEKDCVENNIQLQEDKENSEYENFDNANVSTNPPCLFPRQ
jgi:hypothetical protein